MSYDPEAANLTAQKVTRRRFMEVFQELGQQDSPIKLMHALMGPVHPDKQPRTYVRSTSNSLVFAVPYRENRESYLRLETGEAYHVLINPRTNEICGATISMADSNAHDVVYYFGDKPFEDSPDAEDDEDDDDEDGQDYEDDIENTDNELGETSHPH